MGAFIEPAEQNLSSSVEKTVSIGKNIRFPVTGPLYPEKTEKKEFFGAAMQNRVRTGGENTEKTENLIFLCI